jgi:hypothetical protein
MSKLRIGITGSKLYENKIKIKEFIFNLKKKFDGEVEIIGLGDLYGADKYVKRYALEFGYSYREMNPPHTNNNLYSIMSEGWYNRPYNNRGVFMRNKIFSDYVEMCIVFQADKKTDSILKEFARSKKKIVVID